MALVRLDIFADPACPWCLIGKLRLDRALASRSQSPFAISWHPFEVDPRVPRPGVAWSDYMRARFGNEAAVRRALAPAVAAAADLGFPFDPDRVRWQPNTRNAHRLMRWAADDGVQAEVMDGLMRAHWQEGRPIGETAELVRIGEAAGMDGDAIRRGLAGAADLDAVVEDELHTVRAGITGVPAFLIGGRELVTGAQPVDVWQTLIDRLNIRLAPHRMAEKTVESAGAAPLRDDGRDTPGLGHRKWP